MAKNPAGFHEFCRKRLVALKRKPHTIPLAVLAIAFIYYSLNLTQISNTTALVNSQNMGLTAFVTMLLSVLNLVCFMNAFPHRKKVNVPMLVLMVIMVGILIYCDIYYRSCIFTAISREVNRINPTGKNIFVSNAQSMLGVHMIILIAGVTLTALLPVYTPLLKKLKTSINIESTGDIEAIDISQE